MPVGQPIRPAGAIPHALENIGTPDKTVMCVQTSGLQSIQATQPHKNPQMRLSHSEPGQEGLQRINGGERGKRGQNTGLALSKKRSSYAHSTHCA